MRHSKHHDCDNDENRRRQRCFQQRRGCGLAEKKMRIIRCSNVRHTKHTVTCNSPLHSCVAASQWPDAQYISLLQVASEESGDIKKERGRIKMQCETKETNESYNILTLIAVLHLQNAKYQASQAKRTKKILSPNREKPERKRAHKTPGKQANQPRSHSHRAITQTQSEPAHC